MREVKTTYTAIDYVKGFLAEIRFIPMTIMLLTVMLGAFLAAGPMVNWNILLLVLLNAFCYLYVSHFNDTYWDIRKGEYEKGRVYHAKRVEENSYLPRWGFGYEIPNAPILPKEVYVNAMMFFSALGLATMIYISTMIGWFYSALAIGGLVLALAYSAGLDKILLAGDLAWEIGVVLALWCGYYSQKLAIDPFIMIVSIPLIIALVSVKIMDAIPDTLVDNKINKITLAVYMYRKGLSLKAIRHISYIPLYIAFYILYQFILPPQLRLGALAVIASLLVQQIALHNDETARISIVAVGFTIMIFTAIALAVIYGIISLPAI